MNTLHNNAISLQNITLAYPDGTIVLRNASANIPPSSITYILGASGSGKSTLMQSLIGLLPPRDGNIYIASNDIYEMPPELLYALVGVVFQNGALLEDLTVEENIKLVLQHNRIVPDNMIDTTIDRVLDSVNLVHAKHKFPSELSGGMEKRPALARTLVLDRAILICDEPTSGLDPIASTQVESLLFEIHKKSNHMTLCIISHDIRSAIAHATNIILIYDSHLYSFPTVEAFLNTEHEYIQSFISAGTGN